MMLAFLSGSIFSNPFGKIISCLDPKEILSKPCSEAKFTISRNSPGEITPPLLLILLVPFFLVLQYSVKLVFSYCL
jgi:hypothetical protein